MYIYICIYIYICVSIYIDVFIYVYTYTGQEPGECQKSARRGEREEKQRERASKRVRRDPESMHA